MSAFSLRRWFFILAPILAGLMLIIGVLADPAPGAEFPALIEAYAAEPTRVQLKSLMLHFSYGLFGLIALALAGKVRSRGGWLANGAGLAAFLGITTMPGFIVSDFVDSTLGRELALDEAVRISGLIGQTWALQFMVLPGAFGLALAMPLAAAAAWRARLFPWWTWAALSAGMVVLILTGVTWPGAVVLTIALASLAWQVARVPIDLWDHGLGPYTLGTRRPGTSGPERAGTGASE